MASTFKRRSSGGGGRGGSPATISLAAAEAAASGVTAEDATNKSITEDKNSGSGGVGVLCSPKLSSGHIGSSNHGGRLLKGTKLWTGGITLTSSGLRDLDNLLGSGTAAGQPLGTCIYLEQDRWTHQSLSRSLVKYWCAEVRCDTRCVSFNILLKKVASHPIVIVLFLYC
jgi:PAXNEB protein